METLSKDLSNVKPGDIRLVKFCVGVAHPLAGKYVPAVITWAGRCNSKSGFGIRAKTAEQFLWPEDPEGLIISLEDGTVKFGSKPAHFTDWEGWVETDGHLENQGYPVKAWVSRYSDGHLIMTFHKPSKMGNYWVDPYGTVVPLPKDYYPEVNFENSPKEVTYRLSK